MGDSLAQQARAALRRHVLEPLVAHSVDEQYGGFLVDLDHRWRPAGSQEKSLEHVARTTMVFALLDQAMPGEGCGELTRRGHAYLREVMWDADNGGYFVRVDRQSRPLWDGMKHPHAVTYAVLASHLCRDLLLPGESERAVADGLGWLEDVAWDPKHGGYSGTYRRDNAPYLVGDVLPTPDGRDPIGLALGFKEINTQSDALEMFTMLAAANPSDPGAEPLEALVDLIATRLVADDGGLPFAYRPDWLPAPFLMRVGHAVQTSRRLLEVPGHEDDAPLVATCCRLVDFALANAKHPAGGLCFAVAADGRRWPDTGAASDVRQWWVQLEAIHALHLLAQHELVSPQSRARYAAERDQMWSFVRDEYFDERYRGIREVPARDSRRPPKTHPWKDAVHETTTLLALSRTS